MKNKSLIIINHNDNDDIFLDTINTKDTLFQAISF